MRADSPLPVVVGALINEDDEILLITRDNQPYKGLWVLPGGKWEKGESLFEALLREISEETAYTIEHAQLAGIVSVTLIDGRENLLQHYILFFHTCHTFWKKTGINEHVPQCWACIESLDHIDIAPVDKKLIEIYCSSHGEGAPWVHEAVVQEGACNMYTLLEFYHCNKMEHYNKEKNRKAHQ
jgi:8-oxo-dGTP diphosphatase